MDNIKKGFYSAIYLLKTSKILKIAKREDIITVQFFQMEDNVILCGINKCLDILKKEAYDYNSLKIESLKDGDRINKLEPVLKISGNIWKFIHLEGVIDGILARASTIATNCFNLVKAANNKTLIYMNDRSDYYYTQADDGYFAYIGGIRNFVTQAQVSLLHDKKDIKVVGTIPHSLIQAFNGNIINALKSYNKIISEDKIVALVDYENDVINTSLKVANYYKDKLYAVRIDTSKALVDKSLNYLKNKYPVAEISGVNLHLIKLLREKLDNANFKKVKIIVSSGLTVKKIKELENANCKVDFYGVGRFILSNRLNFACDSVLLNGKKQVKAGRMNLINKNLKEVK